jgi:hypothetical protein
MTITQLPAFILPVLLCVASYGQSERTTELKSDTQHCRSVTAELAHMSQGNASGRQVGIAPDEGAVMAAQKRVRQAFRERGFDDCAATQVTVLAWRELRMKQPQGHLNEDALVKLAEDGYGGLKVVSIPSGADIRVDGLQWDKPTDTDSWTHVGNRTVILSLNGYKDSVGEVNVLPGKVVEYKQKLSRK